MSSETFVIPRNVRSTGDITVAVTAIADAVDPLEEQLRSLSKILRDRMQAALRADGVTATRAEGATAATCARLTELAAATEHVSKACQAVLVSIDDAKRVAVAARGARSVTAFKVDA